MDKKEKGKRNIFSDISNIQLQKLKVKFDKTTLDQIISFIYKDSVLRTRKTLNNIYKLITNLDEREYENEPTLVERLWIIQKSLDAILYEGMEHKETMAQYCLDQPDCSEYSSDLIKNLDENSISYTESKYLLKRVDDALCYGYIITVRRNMKELLDLIEDGDYKSYKAISEDLYTLAYTLINIRRSTSSTSADQTFSLVQDQFEAVVEESVHMLQDRNRIFLTGIKRLNTILSPGLMSKRLYTFLAFPGKGKSTILLKLALDIKKYNKGIKTKDPDKRPAVLFLTLENDIAETVERMYNMTVSSDDIRNYTPAQVSKQMRREGQLTITDDNNIDIIIKEYKNREIDTNDIYGIINDLSDDGVEVVALIVDYMKRIRPFEKASDEKGELKNITNELKELGKFYDMPVITAQQLNRTSATVVDAAIQNNKEDVTRLVGSTGVASAWEIIENSDCVIIVNPETKVDSGQLFMIFKLLKRRYRSIESTDKLRRLDYFAHPFEEGSEIKLVDDVNLATSVSLESLSTQFEPHNDSRGNENAVSREDKSKKKKKSASTEMDLYFDSPFNMETTVNY